LITSFSKLLLSVFFLFISYTGYSQTNFTGYINPEISINISNESPWSHSFGIAQRDVVYTDYENINDFNKELDFQYKFLELNHYTSRQIGFHSKLSAGIRYRFEDGKNETRIIEQYAYSKKIGRIKIAHRLRLAQRYREIATFRTRYRFSVEFPLQGDKVNPKEFSLVTSTEAVWEMGKKERPNLGQRFAAQINYRLFENTRLNLGLEYRHRDYTHSPYVEVFLLSGLKISL